MALRALLLVILFAANLSLPSFKMLAVVASLGGGAALGSYVWTGHGSLGTGVISVLHPGVDVLHLLATGTWFGALTSFGIQITRTHPNSTAIDIRLLIDQLSHFSAIGPAVILVLTLTGLFNAGILVGFGRWLALFDTSYGIVLLLKVALFLGMLIIAAINHFHLVPYLREAVNHPLRLQPAIRRLRASLLTENFLALLILALVAVLGTLEPPISLK